MMSRRILVVDDEQSMRDTLQIMLEQEGYTVDSASGGVKALKMCEQRTYDLVITDLKMPEFDGINLVEAIKSGGYDIPIIIMTAYATKGQAIKALNLGATFFIEKPFKKSELMNFVNSSIKMEELIQENVKLKADIKQSHGLDMIIGTSKEITKIKEWSVFICLIFSKSVP